MEEDSYEQIVPLDAEKTSALISYGGTLEKISENFEQRDSQIELLEKICESFNENQIGIFEAGTGVGKSFAYLIPAIIWAAENNERIVISTGTINLQQQIFEKDLPLAQKITGKKIKAVLMKGRQNFICKRRFFDVLSELSKENDLFENEIKTVEQINEWLKTTKTGNKSDLSFIPEEALWQRINSESDACLANRCPYKSECFVMKMKKSAIDAQILIVNHHLLFADIESRKRVGYDDLAVLPPYHRLVIDEAHGIENAATSFFSESLTKFKIQKQVRLLYRNRKGNQSGLYFKLDDLSTHSYDFSEFLALLAQSDVHIQENEDNAKALLANAYTFRLNEMSAKKAGFVMESLQKISIDLTKIISFIRKMIENLSEDDKTSAQVWETRQVLARIEESASFCTRFIRWRENPDNVFWIENGKIIHFNETPIDISPFLYQGVFENLDTVVCTSATLSIANSFNFYLSRVGIEYDNSRLNLAQFSSPFPYRSNVLFTLPVDVPSPEKNDFQMYLENFLQDYIRAASGRTLVLFTSYESLKNTFAATSEFMKNDEIRLLKQGDDDRFRLLECFKNDISSVLFATYSFWEGVDVPGESLSQVIIVKLPFGVPSDPVFASRCEAIEKRGGSSFMELSVPEAIIKFKQGYGRLMRRSDDYGVVTVLDKRLIEKNYGQIFIQSVPETKMCIENTKEVCRAIENFLS